MSAEIVQLSPTMTAEYLARTSGYSVKKKGVLWLWEDKNGNQCTAGETTETRAWKNACDSFYASTFLRRDARNPIRIQSGAKKDAPTIPYIVQPIVRAFDFSPFGYEILYRGRHPVVWKSVDKAMLRFLAKHTVDIPLFLNLSNETVLSLDENLLFEAHERNSIFLEWSEMVVAESKFEQIKSLLKRWGDRGLRIVIDDFGKGRDALERMFAFDSIHAIKVDGHLVNVMEKNALACDIVGHLVRNCKNRGIQTVAECIETHAQYKLIEKMGFDMVQGYYIDDVLNQAKMKETVIEDLEQCISTASSA